MEMKRTIIEEKNKIIEVDIEGKDGIEGIMNEIRGGGEGDKEEK